MLTTLPAIKSRLALDDSDVRDDALLTNFIALASARFENECNRKFGYAQNVADEFQGDETELRLSRYPLDETQPITFQRLSTLNAQSSIAAGWQQVPEAEFVLRRGCVISLVSKIGRWQGQIRMTYSGGYLLPDAVGPVPPPGVPSLPDDLQFAAVEQIAYWYQNKDRLGIVTVTAEGGSLQQFPKLDLLPFVDYTLARYERWMS